MITSAVVCLYRETTDENSRPIKKRLIPTYDKELQEALLHKFHVGASHFEYYKIYTMLYEKHIGIPQNKVKTFVQKVSYLYPKCNNQRKKNDITPIIASAPCNASG